MDQMAGAAPARLAAEVGPAVPAFQSVRDHTEQLVTGLTDEDQCVQSMPDASPAKWHRAHTTWFFEEFVLRPHEPRYEPFDPAFRYLFNSYYEAVGARHPRPSRGLLTRPATTAVTEYRKHVDAAVCRLLAGAPAPVHALVTLGMQHEQQHQELLLTDMLHAFAQNPLAPEVLPGWRDPKGTADPTQMLDLPGGIVDLGHGGPGFAFDNEGPAHQALLQPYRIADRLVRNADFLAFVQDGGYRTVSLWMSDGWSVMQSGGWTAPLYWRQMDGGWRQFGLGGLADLDPDAPVRHLSWYEADAFARWAGARLPTEAEWEAASADQRMRECDGHVWQWTASPYVAYPGFRPAAGAIGEYNGKFMVNQMTLRGSSAATPPGHARRTYRNFFYPDRRWQFTGLRLAQDA